MQCNGHSGCCPEPHVPLAVPQQPARARQTAMRAGQRASTRLLRGCFQSSSTSAEEKPASSSMRHISPCSPPGTSLSSQAHSACKHWRRRCRRLRSRPCTATCGRRAEAPGCGAAALLAHSRGGRRSWSCRTGSTGTAGGPARCQLEHVRAVPPPTRQPHQHPQRNQQQARSVRTAGMPSVPRPCPPGALSPEGRHRCTEKP